MLNLYRDKYVSYFSSSASSCGFFLSTFAAGVPVAALTTVVVAFF